MQVHVCVCMHMCVHVHMYVNGLSLAPEKEILLLDLLTHCQALLQAEQILSYSSQTFGPCGLLATVTDFFLHLTSSRFPRWHMDISGILFILPPLLLFLPVTL